MGESRDTASENRAVGLFGPSFLPVSCTLLPTQQPCWCFVCIRQTTSFHCPVHSLQWTAMSFTKK